MSIFLVGMMGCGKSSVGFELSKISDYRYLDLDSEIEKDFGCTISEIFSNYGEERFRQAESAKLKVLADKKNLIVATGGGIILNSGNLELLKKANVYYLTGDPSFLYERATRKIYKRPIMKGLSLDGFSQLYNQRRNLYAAVANFTIDVSNMTSKEVAQKINTNETN